MPGQDGPDHIAKRTIPFNGEQVDATVVGVLNATEQWNEYLLDDGSVLKVKLVVTEVLRLDDRYDDKGDPLYVSQSTNVSAVVPAENLRRSG